MNELFINDYYYDITIESYCFVLACVLYFYKTELTVLEWNKTGRKNDIS